MRRTIEIAVLVVFVGVGILLALGKLPMPASSVDLTALLPAAATEGLSVSCESCPLDCPFSSGETQSRPTIDEAPPTVDGTLRNGDAIQDEYAFLLETPLSGGYLVGVREGGADAPGRLWAEVFTSSSVRDTVSWYRAELPAAGWSSAESHDAVVPNGVFLSFRRGEATLNVLVAGDEEQTRVFLDHPLPGG